MATQVFVCHTCGQSHEGPPLSYGSPAPAQWYGIPESERGKRALLSSDQCEIDGKFFFIVGNIDIPLLDAPGVFQWSVWISLSERSYSRVCQLWNRSGREAEEPYFGWLATVLPLYPNTLNLKTLVHTRPLGTRPLVEMEPTDHPLAREQLAGVTMDRVRQNAESILHAR